MITDICDHLCVKNNIATCNLRSSVKLANGVSLFMKKVKGGITRPKGFFAGAVWCGMKKRSKDLCLIYSQALARAAGVFTALKTADKLIVEIK